MTQMHTGIIFRNGAFSRHVLILIVLIIGMCATAFAQTPQYYVTGGTSGNAIPFTPNSSPATFSKWQGFYVPNELTGAYPGNITKVWFKASGAVAQSTFVNARVSLGQLSGVTYPTSAFYSPVTQGFFSTAATVPGSSNQWFSFQLQTPFYYNPSLSLVIEFCSDGTTTGGITILYATTTTPQNISRSYGGTGCSGSLAGSGQQRTDFGIDEAPALPNDAGISGLLSPVNFCAGTYDIQVKLRDFGTNTLNNVTVNWSYDGAPQSPINYTTPLASLAETPLLLGSRTFAASVPHTLKAWTSQPNNVADSFVGNDTLTMTLKPALSGTFTIGGALPDYPTVAAAAADITANGICGPVVFNVRSGTYTGAINFGLIPGASSTNTITLQSETGVRTDVVLTYNAPSLTPTVNFGGADYVTIQNLTIEATNATYGQALTIGGGSDYNKFINCIIRTPIVASTSTNNCAIYSNGSVDAYNEFRNNSIEGGGYCIYWFGGSTTAHKIGTIWQGNTIKDWYYMGIYAYYNEDFKFRDNLVTTNSAYTTNYATYFYYSDYGALEITGNKVLMTNGSGNKYNYLYGSSTPQSTRRLVANNFFASNGGASACYNYHYYMYNTDFYHNTWYINSTATGYCAYIYYGGDIKYLNNIFYSNGPSYVVYGYDSVTPQANVVQMDWNLYYTTGTVFGYWNSGSSYATFPLFQAATGKNQNSMNKPLTFVNANAGDLHLGGASQNDQTLRGTTIPQITVDIDKEPRNLPYVGADEGCFILPGTVTASLMDGNGQPTSFVQYPGTVFLNYNVSFPTTGSWTIGATLNFYSIPSQSLAYTYTFNLNKLSGVPLVGSQAVPIPSLTSGYYRVEVIFNTQNSCNLFINYKPGDLALLAVPFGTTPCVVWPGDVNNDGLVNFGDRKDLNVYIHDANLSPIWLTGPARYRADAATNPMTYYTWEGQASAPWATPMGCYMDADGNGVINSFDYLPQRVNFLKAHGPVVPKQDDTFTATSFSVTQNYPNPFSPTTVIGYAVPEQSRVRMIVTDMLGRQVATLVDNTIESGAHTASFDGSGLARGQYIATVTMTGVESGLSFTKTINMTLDK